ncbi:Bicarbonate transport ATP-binding protein CmpD [Planctomycetes bacterium Poly30]|uniref:Bicarbonate transport ATP-binding protein CmpD n=1 Tax=Saltatorellus ferox TaxID=2528018 RepID=A0A518ET22_9BACT|nr:Bicarbonate transport ATP-binding protein CmpD [Planctomycetes bacterium Poly30]
MSEAMPEPGKTPRRDKITVEGVDKTFPTKKGEVHVLDGVNLTVREGEFLAIVGPSGCGKSTLLNCMAGFERASGGSIQVDGEEVTRPDPKRVFVFQETGIFPWYSVWDNVGFGLGQMPFEAKDEHVMKYIRLVGLEGFERSFPSELSGGMKQRVEFARALAVEPDVLFLDEPFGALDAFTRIEMRREIVRIWEKTGKTCILVTHDVSEALELADRVAIMTRRPATVHSVLDVDMPRPRDSDDPPFREMKDLIFQVLGVERRV